MNRFKIPHPPYKGNNKTNLSLPVSAAATALTVLNTATFANHNWLIINVPGATNAEMQQINNSISSQTSLPITALSNSHGVGEPVYYSDWNQINVYSSATQNGTYTLVTGAPMGNAPYNIQWNQDATLFEDAATVGSGQWYKFSYYNSYTNVESSLSSAIQCSQANGYVDGYDPNSMYNMMRMLRKMVHDEKTKRYSDQDLMDALNLYNIEVQMLSYRTDYEYGMVSSPAISFPGTGSGIISLPTDMYILKYAMWAADSVNYVRCIYMDYVSFQNYVHSMPVEVPASTSPYIYEAYTFIEGNQLEFYPHPSAGTALLKYFPKPTNLYNPSDILFTPIDSYRRAVLCGAAAWLMNPEGNSGLQKKQQYLSEWENFKQEMNYNISQRQKQAKKRVRISDDFFLQSLDD